jgi:hypothetical protein
VKELTEELFAALEVENNRDSEKKIEYYTFSCAQRFDPGSTPNRPRTDLTHGSQESQGRGQQRSENLTQVGVRVIQKLLTRPRPDL